MDTRLLYAHVMGTDTEFTVTEDGMRALVETCHGLYQEVALLSARLDAAVEALVIQGHRLDEVEAATGLVHTF